MVIREATSQDYNAVWEIFRAVIKTGDTYVFDPGTPKRDMENHWFAPYMHTYVAEQDGTVVGTYILKPNQIDLGNHVANGSYMVHPSAQGQGIGKALCEHSLKEARRIGFLAIQFNIVVASNVGAVRLWQFFGFEIAGTLPKVFRHTTLGLVDAHVMYKEL
ncbi:MAG TPA: GNAT family N-acetyltransferase [Cytophagales bacterium]|nr:GNAT family N-acetyltransferase [Cytophagales bacterium]HAA19557.1 GNAT family N-acetyltransferase [Cytophagales bacterium]HAP63189.1 GNAT family N-acetyltransferase [Cytophagales bacterium]